MTQPSSTLLLRQFNSPLSRLLLSAAALSVFFDDPAEAISVLRMLLISAPLGFWQEYGAPDAVVQLLSIIQVIATTVREATYRTFRWRLSYPTISSYCELAT